MPRRYDPMLVTLVDKPFDDPDWVFEPKYDGLRVLARFDGKSVELISRNDKSQNLQFPDVVQGVLGALNKPAMTDGEIVCLDERGRSSFRNLQQRFHLLDVEEIRRRARDFPAYLYLFDILHWNGYELVSLPLEQRKQVLSRAVGKSERVRVTPSAREHGVSRFREACRRHEEGIVGKHLHSRYVGSRSREWVKIKCAAEQEFVIGGWTDPQSSRVALGALLVGYFSDDDKRLIYSGKVGTGYTTQTLLDLRRRLDALARPKSAFDEGDPPTGLTVHWVKPKLVAEFVFAEWTQNGLLRQPRFKGLRIDKDAREVRRERAADSRTRSGRQHAKD